jgi:Ser/Thr protein kinase RdoA (MazF antagonist)
MRLTWHASREEHAAMPRIGLVIRDAYRRPGTEDVARHYGIAVTGSKTIAAGVVRIDRSDGPAWIARLSTTSRPASRVHGDADVLWFLARQDFPAERCAHPEPVSELNGRAVIVTEFVPGKGWPSTPAAHHELGELLGRLHALPVPAAADSGPAQGPPGDGAPGDGVPGDGALRRPAGSLHHLPDFEGGPDQDLAAAAAMLADLDGRVPPEHQQTYDALLALLPSGDGCHGLPETFVHPDPAQVNVIATPAGPVLIDWTGAGTGPRLSSLAVLLHTAGPRHAAAVMKGYQRHQQLTGEELGRLEGALWIRPLWLAAWQCWLTVVSPKVSKAWVPNSARIAAVAAATRAASVTA